LRPPPDPQPSDFHPSGPPPDVQSRFANLAWVFHPSSHADSDTYR
jgi:hypothetical protein